MEYISVSITLHFPNFRSGTIAIWCGMKLSTVWWKISGGNKSIYFCLWHFLYFRMPPSSIWKPDILMYNRYSKEQKYLIFETFTLRTLLYVFYRYLIRENIFIGNINGNNIVMLQRERGVWWNLSDQCGGHQWRDVHLYSARYPQRNLGVIILLMVL